MTIHDTVLAYLKNRKTQGNIEEVMLSFVLLIMSLFFGVLIAKYGRVEGEFSYISDYVGLGTSLLMIIGLIISGITSHRSSAKAYKLTVQNLTTILKSHADGDPQDKVVSEIYGSNVFGGIWYSEATKAADEYAMSIKAKQSVGEVLNQGHPAGS